MVEKILRMKNPERLELKGFKGGEKFLAEKSERKAEGKIRFLKGFSSLSKDFFIVLKDLQG